MYRRCIFCSADLGTNDVLEEFPVGRQLAFDAWKGRLWVVCQVCSRWNLAPIEERWEPVEACERLFRDARLRAQSENIGLARLADGTRLVRVGEALTGELAAWRYGAQLVRRRKRYLVGSALGTGGVLAALGGLSAMGVGFMGFYGLHAFVQHRQQQKVVYRVPSLGVTIRRWHVPGINVTLDDHTGSERGMALTVRDAHLKEPKWTRGDVRRHSNDVVTLSGDDAVAALRRTMLLVNHKGASAKRLDDAHAVLADAGSADALVRRAGALGLGLGKRAGDADAVTGADALAFEMALNEESERRALEGELIVLERAWREAEEIAAIADALPFEEQIRRLIRL